MAVIGTSQMKSATWLGIASGAFLWATVASGSSCQDVLNNGLYPCCSFVADTGETFNGCFRFTSPGTLGDFDIQANIFSTVVSSFNGACSCDPTGSLKTPKFDAAATFDCLPSGFGGLVLAGKAGKTSITKGHITRADGHSVIFTCGPGPCIGTRPPCQCQPAGQPCSGGTYGACCEGLTCGLSRGTGPGMCQ
jgi:hypothetical protein